MAIVLIHTQVAVVSHVTTSLIRHHHHVNWDDVKVSDLPIPHPVVKKFFGPFDLLTVTQGICGALCVSHDTGIFMQLYLLYLIFSL